MVCYCIRFICAYYSVKYAIGISVTTVVHGIKMQGMKNQHSGTTTPEYGLLLPCRSIKYLIGYVEHLYRYPTTFQMLLDWEHSKPHLESDSDNGEVK